MMTNQNCLKNCFSYQIFSSLETSILESIFMVNNKKNQPLELKVDNLFFLGSSNFIHHNNVQYNILFAVKVAIHWIYLDIYYSTRWIFVLLVAFAQTGYCVLSTSKSWYCQRFNERGSELRLFNWTVEAF